MLGICSNVAEKSLHCGVAGNSNLQFFDFFVRLASRIKWGRSRDFRMIDVGLSVAQELSQVVYNTFAYIEGIEAIGIANPSSVLAFLCKRRSRLC